MRKYDRFYPVIFHEEDRRPLTFWHKLGICFFALAALYIWLTPDAPEVPKYQTIYYQPNGFPPCEHSRDPACWKYQGDGK